MKETTNIHGTDEGNLTVVLPAVRKLLATRDGPLVAILRRQLSNYERGDAESRAALKPMILASVGKIEARI